MHHWISNQCHDIFVCFIISISISVHWCTKFISAFKVAHSISWEYLGDVSIWFTLDIIPTEIASSITPYDVQFHVHVQCHAFLWKSASFILRSGKYQFACDLFGWHEIIQSCPICCLKCISSHIRLQYRSSKHSTIQFYFHMIVFLF